MSKWAVYAAVLGVVVAVTALAFFLGGKNATQNQPEAAAQKAAEDTAKSETPFKSASPLSGVEANPFEKTKKVLNPFEN